jgi:uncharacterized protein
MKKSVFPRGKFRWSVLSAVAWILCGAAFASMLVLDRMNWTRGEKSYIFTGPRVERAKPASARPPGKTGTPAASKPEPRQETKPAEAPPPRRQAPAKQPAGAAVAAPFGRVALIVDDMGNNLEALDELLDLRERVTISVLPYGDYAAETARIAHDRGLEVLLHLPLESLNNHESESNTRGLITSGMSAADVLRIVDEDLARVPFISGVNNHMGSKVTADESMMRLILEPVRRRGLFFLDSRTSGKSVAYDVARSMGIPAAARQVFLDADGDNGRIKERLHELFRIARKDGRAVGICHPYRETLNALRENFRSLDGQGVEAVSVSDILKE